MIDEATSLLSAAILLLGCGMWPVAFLFAGCAPCCGDDDDDDPCPWVIAFTRCLKVTHVGTDPLVGGDCRLLPISGTTGGVRTVTAGPIQIRNVQTSIRIPVRLSLSASGSSRTPVGETRSQVWRFNVARPQDLTPYDVVGPPWHLQVDLSVTGVATQQEAGVQSAIATDEHGQPKLVLTVNQWTATITHDEQVTISPVGLQRWDARLTEATVTAALVSGGVVSGWIVTKIAGISVLERSIGVMVSGGGCTLGGLPFATPFRVFLNELNANAFLNGDTVLRLSTPQGDRDLQVFADNILCQVDAKNIGVGAALGIYPKTLRAVTPAGTVLTLRMRLSAAREQISIRCNDEWEGFSDNPPPPTFSTVFRPRPSDFWSGLTLLWNLENGPYRNSFVSPNGAAEVFLEGGGSVGSYTPATIPEEGGAVTDNETGVTTIVGSNGSRLPNAIFSGEVLQGGACELRGLRELTQSTFAGLSSSVFVVSLPSDCYLFLPIFGSSGATCFEDPSGFTSIPCDDCMISTVVTEGDEYGIVRVVNEGDKAGLIEVIPKKVWRGGEGVTFTITCGNDAITQRVQRQNTVPEAPINLTATRGPCSQATLSWQAPHDGGSPITGYRVERRIFNTGSYQLYSTAPGPALSASVFDLLRLGYQFRVAAINALGTGPYSNIAAVDGFTLGAPTNLAVTRDPCDTANLSWTPPTQSECVVVASYRMEYRTFGTSAWTSGGTVAGTQTTGSIAGLPTNVRLEFRVARVADAGSDLFTGTATSGNLPFVPSAPTATLGETAGSVNLTWTAQETACFENTDYNIQFAAAGSSTWSDFARSPSAAKAAIVTGLTLGVTYFFRLRSVNAIGTSSFSSASGSITIPA